MTNDDLTNALARPKKRTSVLIEPWYPTSDGSGRPTQVHVIVDDPNGGGVIFRFHSGEGADRFISDLAAARRFVWGDPS
jgi:hypothetical protein